VRLIEAATTSSHLTNAIFLLLLLAAPCSHTAHYVYPIRVRFPNILTGKVEWVIVGFIPIVKTGSDDSTEKDRVRMLRDEVLQRCLAVLLDSFIPASETGVLWNLPGVGPVWVVPRVILYAADQPEERHLLGLKLAGCAHPCSHCLVDKGDAGCPHAPKPVRDVVDNVEAQLSSAAMWKSGCGPAVLDHLSEDSSIVPIVPLLGAVHGLGTGSFALYDIFGFDLLHVRLLPFCLRLFAFPSPVLLPIFSSATPATLLVAAVSDLELTRGLHSFGRDIFVPLLGAHPHR